MYDTEGKYVARYHKYNLFNSEFSLFNIDKKEQNVFVDTDFGKFDSICLRVKKSFGKKWLEFFLQIKYHFEFRKTWIDYLRGLALVFSNCGSC